MFSEPSLSPAIAGAPTSTNFPAVPAWQPDNGDGTYRNPVLFADYSDPDAIRVGEDFWMTASSFGHVPGLPILHSRDLVNWSLVNYALPRLVPVDHFSLPRHGGGVWAPSIRFHDGLFWIYYPDPDFGLYVTTAKDPGGSWSEPILVRGGKGLIDPCPLWDDDGQVYLVHGWAKSRAGVCNRVTLHRLSSDGTRTIDEGRVIIDADLIPGWHTLEGPKIYRRNGYYYVFAPAGGVATGVQTVFRARDISGPYEPRIVLEQGRTEINGPHQGAWVDTASSEHWFLHFQDRGPFGRVVHLQPMEWGSDGWPRMGRAAPTGIGEPVLEHAKPRGCIASPAVPPTSDDFHDPAPGLQWQWQANPEAGWATVVKGHGLRLAAVASSTETLWNAPALLMQKFPAPSFIATTRMTVNPHHAPESCGLVVFGYDYAWLGLRRTSNGFHLVLSRCERANEGGTEASRFELPTDATTVSLRVAVGVDSVCAFSYALDEGSFVPVPAHHVATVSRWVGAKVGLFARADAKSGPAAYADFGSFDLSRPV